MTIWGDADSLPARVRELCARRSGAAKFEIRVIFVSARKIPLPPGRLVFAVVVSGESADDHIIASAKLADIIITRDIPLAKRALDTGLIALNDRGTIWTRDTVRERLSIRDFMAAARDAGLAEMSRASTFGQKEQNAFANALDKAILLSASMGDDTGSPRT